MDIGWIVFQNYFFCYRFDVGIFGIMGVGLGFVIVVVMVVKDRSFG